MLTSLLSIFSSSADRLLHHSEVGFGRPQELLDGGAVHGEDDRHFLQVRQHIQSGPRHRESF